MIYHIADDEKVIDYAIDQFETVAAKQNIFLINKSINEKLDHIKKRNTTIVKARFNDAPYQNTINCISNNDIVIFHNLYGTYKARIGALIPKETICVGILWGVEVYNNITYEQLDSNTIRELKRYNRLNFLQTITNKIKHYFNKARLKESESQTTIQLFYRLNYTATYITEDYQLIKHLLNKSCDNLWFSYYSIENILNENINKTCNGNNILLGNSAFASNNHITAIDQMAKFNNNYKIIIPLNYGDKRYGNLVAKYAKKKLNLNVECIRDFLQKDKYNEIIRSCDIVIMNHSRQQAMGNIITCLWFGSKVFLNENSNSYKYLKSIGAIIFSINKDLDINNDNSLKPISESERNHNRFILMNQFSRKNIYNTTKLLTQVTNKSLI